MNASVQLENKVDVAVLDNQSHYPIMIRFGEMTVYVSPQQAEEISTKLGFASQDYFREAGEREGEGGKG